MFIFMRLLVHCKHYFWYNLPYTATGWWLNSKLQWKYCAMCHVIHEIIAMLTTVFMQSVINKSSRKQNHSFFLRGRHNRIRLKQTMKKRTKSEYALKIHSTLIYLSKSFRKWAGFPSTIICSEHQTHRFCLFACLFVFFKLLLSPLNNSSSSGLLNPTQ